MENYQDAYQQKTPNPQGKGLAPVLAALTDARQSSVILPKQIEQIASELFTSMFVLESDFGFKPVLGRAYWLYGDYAGRSALANNSIRFKLSLLSPDQWSTGHFGQLVGRCELQSDLTWTLALSDEAAANSAFQGYVAERRRAFGEELQAVDSVDELLPVFRQQLPFYQRVFASAMAGSLACSMEQSGIQGLSYDQARGLLKNDP